MVYSSNISSMSLGRGGFYGDGAAVAGNSVLEGNLVMAAGSTMHFAEDAVLTMGCSVSIGVGSSLEIDNYDPFRSYVLFKDVETLVLGNYVVTEEGVYDVSGLLTGINGVTNLAALAARRKRKA